MPLPPLVVSGQVIAASHINAIRNYLPLMADGSAATPGFRFEDDPDTGLHRPGSNQLAVVTGGAVRVTVSASAVTLAVPLAMGGQNISGIGSIAGASIDVTNSFFSATGTITIRPQNVGATEGGELQLSNHSGGTWSLDVFNDVFRVFKGGGGGQLMTIDSSGNVIHNGVQLTIQSATSSGTGILIGDVNRQFITGINIGGLGSAYYQIYDLTAGVPILACQGTDIKLFLGGSLKSLSVDGSGFVKAT